MFRHLCILANLCSDTLLLEIPMFPHSYTVATGLHPDASILRHHFILTPRFLHSYIDYTITNPSDFIVGPEYLILALVKRYHISFNTRFIRLKPCNVTAPINSIH